MQQLLMSCAVMSKMFGDFESGSGLVEVLVELDKPVLLV